MIIFIANWNPAINILTVDLNLKQSENISLEIVNNLGQNILSYKMEVLAGATSKNIDIQKLENGIYFLVMKSGENSAQRVFSVLR